MQLPLGKVPIDILREVVFKNLGAERSEVVLGPSAGIDGAVVEIGNKSLIVSMDPITGAVERVGWLVVNINANDVATFGVEPSYFVSCILLPEDADRRTVEAISTEMNRAAANLGIAIVGGHCETTPKLKNPIVVGCMMGTTEKGNYVTAARAKAGDIIIMTKSAGIEGTAILASEKQKQLRKTLGARRLASAKRFYERISVVKDATTAYSTGGVHAMHDPTEGGIAGALHEIADASGLGFIIREEKIRIETETRQICGFFDVDPLQLIASGSLIIAADPKFAERIVSVLSRERIVAETIGEFKATRTRTIRRKTGRREDLVRPASDPLWRALGKSRV
jgi:hydrogenase maturation factor